jgi:hypothetical protein
MHTCSHSISKVFLHLSPDSIVLVFYLLKLNINVNVAKGKLNIHNPAAQIRSPNTQFTLANGLMTPL